MGKLHAIFTIEYFMYGVKVVEQTNDMKKIMQWYSAENKLWRAV